MSSKKPTGGPKPPGKGTYRTLTDAERERVRQGVERAKQAIINRANEERAFAGEDRSVAADGIDEGAWDGDAARFSPAQWRQSCLIDTGEGDPDAKSRYKLPVRTPSGALNRNAVHAAAAALAGGRGGVQVSPAAKTSAAKQLVRLYGQLEEDVPPSIAAMAK